MLEMALCSTAIFLVILGIMECSRAMYVEHSISSMARDAARYAMVRGADWSGTSCIATTTYSCEATATDISTYIKNNAPPGITRASITIVTTWPGTSASGTPCDTTSGSNSAGCIVRVKLTYPFTFLLPAPNNTAITFSSTAVMTITQ
jgi:Flp pilus assembly protein TadG